MVSHSILLFECVGGDSCDTFLFQLHPVPAIDNLIIDCPINGYMTILVPIRDGSVIIHNDIPSLQELPCLESR